MIHIKDNEGGKEVSVGRRKNFLMTLIISDPKTWCDTTKTIQVTKERSENASK